MFINIARAVEAQTTLTYAFPGRPTTVADPGEYIYTVFTFALGIVGVVALGFLVYGGIRYILSAGNPSALADAKDRMTAALIGVVLLLSSYLILNTIDPRLLSLTITELAPVTPGKDISFEIAQHYADTIADLIRKGDSASAKAQYEKAKLEKISDLRKIEGLLATETPEEAAKLFLSLDPLDQHTLIMRATQNKLGSPGYDPTSDYNLSGLLQRLPTDTIINNYFGLSSRAQREILGQISDTQRVDLYRKFGAAGGATQQESYMSQLTADHIARIYQNFKAAGTGQDAYLARQIAQTSRGFDEARREVIGVWKRLRPGAERELFLKQAKQAGWSVPIDAITQANLRLASPNASEVDIANEQALFDAEWARQ